MRAADASQDSILSASAASITQQARFIDGEATVDIPYAAFRMLGVTGEDRVFYRIGLEDGEFLSGYEYLPVPAQVPSPEEAVMASEEARAAMAGYHELVQQGRREIYTLEA